MLDYVVGWGKMQQGHPSLVRITTTSRGPKVYSMIVYEYQSRYMKWLVEKFLKVSFHCKFEHNTK
jgi:hypothetical protein